MLTISPLSKTNKRTSYRVNKLIFSLILNLNQQNRVHKTIFLEVLSLSKNLHLLEKSI